MYHPPDLGTNDNSRDEFIEVQNISGAAVSLFHSQALQTWRLRGAVDFDFPTNLTVPPGGLLLVVSFDPSSDTAALDAFRAHYNLASGLPIVGPYAGQLDNSTETIELQKPDAPESGVVPFIQVEQVQYRDVPPWPAAADGTGSSLQRLVAQGYANEPLNWFAAGLSPGRSNAINLAPSARILSPTNGAVIPYFETAVNISVEVTDAGWFHFQS